MTASFLPDREAEIRHFHLFAGLGGFARGVNGGQARVGHMVARFRCIGGVDVSPAAIADFERLAGVRGTVLDLFDVGQYRAFHGKEPPPGWREATADDLRAAGGGERPHFVCTSPPCLPGKGLVLTSTGPRPIETVRADDKVLTHLGRWRRVVRVGATLHTGDIYQARLNGTVDVQEFTAEHPIWRRRVVRPAAGGHRRKLGAPEFVHVSRLRVGDRVGFPVVPEKTGRARVWVDSFGDPQLTERAGRPLTSSRTVDLRPKAEDEALWFLLGVYLGDGWRRKDTYGVGLAVGPTNGELATEVRTAARLLGLPCREEAAHPSNVKLWIEARHFWMLAGDFGDGAENKAIPEPLQELETVFIKHLLRGYRASDGSESAARLLGRLRLQSRWRIASVSLPLLRGVQRLLLRLGIYGGINECWPGGPQTIEGRSVQTRPRWELAVRLDPKKRTIHEFADGAVWIRVRSITTRPAAEREDIWNLEVEEDNTFCAPLIATHNCKGYSGLLSESRSKSAQYQALNRLTLRGVRLALEAWGDDPPEFFLLENVPRIATRGRSLLDEIEALLEAAGYAVAETTHDCGELGNLAQSRRRFLLVARHREKVPPFLYEPHRRPLRGVGEILGAFPLPSDPAAGPMHRMRELQWKTWVRLAFVEAGGDWRSLERLRVVDGNLADFGIEPEAGYHNGHLGVTPWADPAGTITGGGRPCQGRFSVADTGESSPNTGRFAVADPRLARSGPAFNNVFRVVPWGDPSPSVTGPGGPGGLAVADPRADAAWNGHGKYRVTAFDEPAGAVIGASTTGNGAFAVADPRAALRREDGAFEGSGHYGVIPWAAPSGAITGRAGHDRGAFNVADPRVAEDGAYKISTALPAAAQKLVAVIRALDGTWHRPFTTLELAALQGLLEPGEHLVLEGLSDSAWRERIGNAIPSPTGKAIASVVGRALLLAWTGQTFALGATPIWVRPIVVAVSLDPPRLEIP